jgi:hypothetical protein
MNTEQPQIITIETSPRNAYTDPDTGMRFYRFQGRDLPSVTTLRRMAGVPHGLVSWQLSKVVERATSETDTLTAMLSRPKRPREHADKIDAKRRGEAGKWLRAAATEERDASSSLGTAVHDAAAQGFTPDTLPDPYRFLKDGQTVELPAADIAPRLGWYRDWLVSSKATIVAAEFQVANLTVGYAGSCDLLVRFPTGAQWIVDIKTGKGTYPEHALQVLAYRNGEVVFHDDQVNAELTAELHRTTGLAILHLADDGWTFEALRETDDLWDAFLGLHRFAMWSHQHPDMTRLVYGRRESRVELEAAA